MIENPYDDFHRDDYLEINSRRFEHLDSLSVDFVNKDILEIGAGIGDHTDHLLKFAPRSLFVTDVRDENLQILRNKFKDNHVVSIGYLDMDNPVDLKKSYDICYCYGLLYHLSKPERAIKYLSEYTKNILLLETCVDYFNDDAINETHEQREIYSQSFHGEGCRPGRAWLHSQLKKHFEFVYMPLFQPDHEQFPVNWMLKNRPSRLTRSIFVASRKKIYNPALSELIPLFQIKYGNNIPRYILTWLGLKNFLFRKFIHRR